jgi:hypothetical protein
MRLSYGYSVGREYFDDKCHEYFGVDELVNQFGYDLGDFYVGNRTEIPLEKFSELYEKEKLEKKQKNCPHPHTQNFPPFVPEIFTRQRCVACKKILPSYVEDKLVATTWFNGDTVSVCDEPVFKSAHDKETSYEVVTRMLLDIPEWEDDSVDTGLYR